MPDAPLPTGQELAARLFELGLAPPNCEEVAIYGTPRYWYRWHGGVWEPGNYIHHCWYLAEQFGLSIECAPVGGRDYWWITPHGLEIEGLKVSTFAEVPAAICHAVLKVQAWRAEK